MWSPAKERGSTRHHRTPRGLFLLSMAFLLSPLIASGQARQEARPSDALHQLNDSIEALVQRISPTVVQIMVTGYGPAEDAGRGQTADVIGKRQAVGWE